MPIKLNLLLWSALVAGLLSVSQAGYHERRLLYYLFHPGNRSSTMEVHNPVERPVKNESGVLYVWFKASLQQIIDVDEKNQILFANIWLDLTWHDYHFMWDPKDFGGITKINIDPQRVWRPDILLYNSADEKFDGTYPTNVVIEHTGNMNFIPPGMFRSTCKIDTTWFPFDTQVCKLKFGSWSYDGGTLDLRLKCSNESLNTTEMRLNDPLRCSEIGQADLETYITSGEWNLEGVGRRTSPPQPPPVVIIEWLRSATLPPLLGRRTWCSAPPSRCWPMSSTWKTASGPSAAAAAKPAEAARRSRTACRRCSPSCESSPRRSPTTPPTARSAATGSSRPEWSIGSA